MKSKNTFTLMIIVSLILIPIFGLNYNNNFLSSENPLEDSSERGEKITSLPQCSDIDNTDKVQTAEKIARWLFSKWEENHWNETGNEIVLGQEGVAGIGGFFIELYKKTNNNDTYSRWASQVGEWLIDQHPTEYPDGKWPYSIGSTEPANYTGYTQGAAGIGSFFAKLNSINSTSQFENQAKFVDSYLTSVNITTASGKASAWKERDGVHITGDEGLTYPFRNDTIYGTNQTDFDTLFSYDGIEYEMLSEEVSGDANRTDTTYIINIFDTGIPSSSGLDIFYKT